jgi:hypothetical protein
VLVRGGAALAGVLLRALVLGHTAVGKEAAFLAVSLAFTLLFVLAGRIAGGLLARRVAYGA